MQKAARSNRFYRTVTTENAIPGRIHRMKATLSRLALIILHSSFFILPLAAPAATNDLTSLLQQGLFEEEANRNLDSAIASYQSLAAKFDQDRQIAATAMFRLGECYRKLGKTNEAVVQYQRIVREFSDQQILTTLSRQNLAGLGSGDSRSSEPADADARLFERLRQLPPEQVEQVLPTLVPDALLTSLQQQRSQAEEKLELFKKDYTIEHPVYRNQRGVVDLLNKRITERVEGILAALQIRAASSQPAARAATADANTSQSAAAAGSDEEEQEIHRIQAIIQNSPDLINATSGDSRMTPLGCAARDGQLRVAQYLLDHGAGVGIRTGNGETPLILAARGGHRATVELLLAHGADVNSTGGSDNSTALHAAAWKGYRAVAEVLLAHKADVNARDRLGRTPLRLVKQGDDEVVSLLLAAGADVNAKDSSGNTPLHFAAQDYRPAVLNMFLERKGDVNVRNGKDETPLFFAVRFGATNAIALLLKAGTEINARDKDGRTALFTAARERRSDAAKMLLAAGANPNIPAEGDRLFPLHHAVAAGDATLTQALLEHGADPNIRYDDGVDKGKNVLHVAAGSGLTNSILLLVQHGADVNARDSDGNTPLHFAVSRGNADAVRTLLALKADPNVRNQNGMTPLDYAKQRSAPALPGPILRIPPPTSTPAVHGQTAASPLADTLRQYGALDDLPKLDRIEISRQSSGYRSTASIRGTNDWNRFTLLECLAYKYQFLRITGQGTGALEGTYSSYFWWGNDWRFPDLSRVMIRRPSRDGKSRTSIQIDVSKMLEAGDCSLDPPLQWGDVVDIPETDHPIDQRWEGLKQEYLDALFRCIARRVTVSIKSTNATLVLTPQYREGAQPGEVDKSIAVGFMWCGLRSVLDQSHLLRASSDLSRVKVTRVDPTTAKKRQWVLDCSGKNAPDLWLRDGDVIEVPEK